jgi:hypothetical protein
LRFVVGLCPSRITSVDFLTFVSSARALDQKSCNASRRSPGVDGKFDNMTDNSQRRKFDRSATNHVPIGRKRRAVRVDRPLYRSATLQARCGAPSLAPAVGHGRASRERPPGSMLRTIEDGRK